MLSISVPQAMSTTGNKILVLGVISLVLQGPVTNLTNNFQSSVATYKCAAVLTAQTIEKVHEGYVLSLDSIQKEIQRVGSKWHSLAEKIRNTTTLSESFMEKAFLVTLQKIKAFDALRDKCVARLANSYKSCRLQNIEKYNACMSSNDFYSTTQGLCSILKLGMEFCRPLRRFKLCIPLNIAKQSTNLLILKKQNEIDELGKAFNFESLFNSQNLQIENELKKTKKA